MSSSTLECFDAVCYLILSRSLFLRTSLTLSNVSEKQAGLRIESCFNNNGIYRALFTKRPGVLTQLAVTCSAR